MKQWKQSDILHVFFLSQKWEGLKVRPGVFPILDIHNSKPSACRLVDKSKSNASTTKITRA